MTIHSLLTYANSTLTEPRGIHFFYHALHTSFLFRTIPKGGKEQRESASGHKYLQLSPGWDEGHGKKLKLSKNDWGGGQGGRRQLIQINVFHVTDF